MQKMLPKSKQNKLKKLVLKRIPILQWLPMYSKFQGVSDLIAGITLGLTLMPQSMAYATLAGLPPQYGLYSSFIGPFLYTFFGTVKEVSIGPASLMALLTLAYTEELPIDFKILLTFLCGVTELLMGLLGLGFTVEFISAAVISGFTSASSIIIIRAQLKALLGVKFKSGNIFHDIKQFSALSSTINNYDFVLGTCCIVFLIIFRQFKDIKSKNKIITKIFWILSISRNAIIVLIGSLITYYYEFKYGKSPFTISGTVVPGIPIMKLPHFSTTMGNKTVSFIEMTSTLGSGFIIIPVVAVLANVAIAKAFAAGKVVDATQEMVTLGLCNIFGSFMQAMPTTGAFTRSAVANASGIRTPLAGIYTGIIILLALTFLTPSFYYVPKATLAAVLISAVSFMIDYKIIPVLWRTKRYDLFIMAVTFTVCLVYGVEQGLLVGILASLIPLVKTWARPKFQFSVEVNRKGREYILIKPEIGLYYCGSDYFTQQIVKLNSRNNSLSPVVIDCTNVIEIDYTVALTLKNLIQLFKMKHQDIMFFNLKKSVFNRLCAVIESHDLHSYSDIEELHDGLDEIKYESSKDIEMALLPCTTLK